MRYRRISVLGAVGALVALSVTTGAAQATPIEPTSAQLAKWGFTVTPNVRDWGGTAVLAKRGVVHPGVQDSVSGTAPSCLAVGARLTLRRFVPADSSGSGKFIQIGKGLTATVRADHTYRMGFAFGNVGLNGYSLSGRCDQEVVTADFQINSR